MRRDWPAARQVAACCRSCCKGIGDWRPREDEEEEEGKREGRRGGEKGKVGGGAACGCDVKGGLVVGEAKSSDLEKKGVGLAKFASFFFLNSLSTGSYQLGVKWIEAPKNYP